ncbi:MAG: prepilin-type N-terminal cleavage/methylation domain-containing protein [Phycisphaerales bacterium]|nr:prepilin-type N-terminal cleavage/methylation domain-containing protein [Phycisphaerales bacterium]
MSRNSSIRRAFTLIELLLVVAIIALLISILLPAIGKARNSAQMSVCMSNMRQMVTASFTYGADAKDQIAALNWTPGTYNDPNVLTPANDGILIIQGRQAKAILDRRSDQNLTLVQNRYFNRNFWHLPLVDGFYLGNANAIVPAVGCPSDSWVKIWQKNVGNRGVLTGIGPETTAQPNGAYEMYRPFWSTYQMVPVAFSVDKSAGPTVYPAYAYSNFHHIFENASFPIGKRKFLDVNFPSQKVMMFDVFDRHGYKRPIWHAYDIASQPLAFFDTSVRFTRNKNVQYGWNHTRAGPGSPTAAIDPRDGRRVYAWTTYDYNPATGFRGYDHPTLSGQPIDRVKGYFRWTALGLKGYDVVTAR